MQPISVSKMEGVLEAGSRGWGGRLGGRKIQIHQKWNLWPLGFPVSVSAVSKG